MAALLDNCKFNPTAGGTTDWTFSTAVTGYMSPALAGVVNGTKYKYFAVSADLSQWELGEGAYNTGTGVLPRTTVLYNSSGTGTATGQSGAGTKINFTNPPFVAIVGLAEDIARAPNQWTRTVFTSGSGTYNTPSGCRAIRVRGISGGGGGAGSGTTPGAPTAGGSTTFGTSLLSATGGAAGTSGGGAAAGGIGSGATSSTGVNASGQNGGASQGALNHDGGYGGNAPFGLGFGGPGGPVGANAGSVAMGFGGGGGGAADAGTGNTGGGGGGGGGFDVLIANPLTSYAYAVGAAGNHGTAGTAGAAGGDAVAGILIIDEYY